MTDEREPYSPEEQDPPARQSRGSSACAVIGCLLIIALLVGLGAGAYVLGERLEPLADRFLWAPHDVVREYLDAYEDDNTARASRFLREGTPLLDPGAAADGSDTWTRGAVDAFPYPRDGGRVGIFFELHLPIRTTRVQALVEREEDGWRICALQ